MKKKKKDTRKNCSSKKQFMRGQKGEPRTKPSPVYEVVGWITDAEAAEIRTAIAPPKRRKGQKNSPVVRTSTIGRWRPWVQNFNLHDTLIFVNHQQILDFPKDGLPKGNPDRLPEDSELPFVEELPDEFTITLRRRDSLPNSSNQLAQAKKRSSIHSWDADYID